MQGRPGTRVPATVLGCCSYRAVDLVWGQQAACRLNWCMVYGINIMFNGVLLTRLPRLACIEAAAFVANVLVQALVAFFGHANRVCSANLAVRVIYGCNYTYRSLGFDLHTHYLSLPSRDSGTATTLFVWPIVDSCESRAGFKGHKDNNGVQITLMVPINMLYILSLRRARCRPCFYLN